MHKSQVFGYLLVSFLVGVFVGPWFHDATLATLALILLGTIIIVVSGYERTFVKTKKAERNRRVGIIVGVCGLAIALGVFRYSQANLNNSVLTGFAKVEVGGKGISVTLRGFVDGEMSIKNNKAQVVFRVTELEVPDRVFMVNERTLIFLNTYPVYKIGDTLSVVGPLQLPDNFSPDFDYVQYLKNKDIRTAIAYPKIINEPAVPLSVLQKFKIKLYQRIFAVKEIFQSSITRSLSPPYSAYINGILLGTRGDIPEDISEAFNRTSTTHILAISGYNITIIGEALLFILVFFMRRRRAFWVSVAVIILFTVMTGASASVVRASIMGLLLLFANGYGRLYDPKNSILLAGGIMIFLDPLALRYDVGFQLSFLAVFGLMYIAPILKERFRQIPERFGLKEIILLSISAQIMVAPLLAYVFNTFSLVSIPANFLILPLMPYVMLFGFLTGLGGIILEPIGRAVGFITWVISSYQLHVIQWLSDLPFSVATVAMSSLVLITTYFLIIFGIWSIRKINGNKTS